MFNPCGYEHRQMALSLHKIKIYVIGNNSKTSSQMLSVHCSIHYLINPVLGIDRERTEKKLMPQFREDIQIAELKSHKELTSGLFRNG